MNRFIEAQWDNFKQLPLIINIGTTEVDGELRCYKVRGCEEPTERTIINITVDDVIMPKYKNLK